MLGCGGIGGSFSLTPRLDQRRRTRIFRNGEYDSAGGKTLYLEEDMTMPQLLNHASKRLGMSVSLCFNSDGMVVDDVILIENDDVLFFSDGEPFCVPRRKSSHSNSNSGSTTNISISTTNNATSVQRGDVGSHRTHSTNTHT